MGTFMTCITSKYFDFFERSSRKEYWIFTLFYIVLVIVLSLVDAFLYLPHFGGTGVLTVIFILGTIVPSLAVTVRRLHDSGRSFVWMLLFVIPFIGWIAWLILMLLPGDDHPNDYGFVPE